MAHKKKLFSMILLYIVLILIVCIVLFPLYWMLVTAMRPKGEILTGYSLFPPLSRANWGIFREVLTMTNKPVLRWIQNSVEITSATTALSIIAALFGGFALSRYFRFKTTAAIGYLLLTVRLLPPVLLIVPLYVIFARLGMINSKMSLVLAKVTFILPFALWLMKGFFDGIPRELEEAAKVDGCSTTQALFRVIVPVALPGIAAVAIYSIVNSWTDYLYASVLVRNENFTITVGVTTFIQEYVINWNGLMAASLIGIAPLIIAFLFLEKYLVSGLASGGVKG